MFWQTTTFEHPVPPLTLPAKVSLPRLHSLPRAPPCLPPLQHVVQEYLFVHATTVFWCSNRTLDRIWRGAALRVSVGDSDFIQFENISGKGRFLCLKGGMMLEA